MPIIKKITALETLAVRHPILRKGKPIASCQFEGDDLTSTLHFGLFVNEQIHGVLSVFKSNNPHFKDTNQVQFRGMAILENNQRKGYGKQVVLHAESYLQEQNVTIIWFNARENAVAFYEKLGYEKSGPSFEIESVGSHYVMWKRLRS